MSPVGGPIGRWDLTARFAAVAVARETSGAMRVLYVHTATQPPLGADTWIHAQIIRHLDRADHEVHVACRTSFGGAPTPTYEAIRDIPDTTIIPVDFGTELGGSLAQKLRGLLAALPAVPSLARLFALVRRRRVRI